jgi:PAS domain S-box-containing protein
MPDIFPNVDDKSAYKDVVRQNHELKKLNEQITEKLEKKNVLLNAEMSERRRLEEFMNNILQNFDESFIVIDPEYRIISANMAYCERVQLQVKDIIGKHCYEVSHKRNTPCYEAGEECAVRHAFETEEPYILNYTRFKKEGDPIYLVSKSFPVKNSSGKVISVIEFKHDITEKKKLEEQLRQSQKMEAMGQLAGGIVHDFNNILTAIVGYGNLLQINMKQDNSLSAYVDIILSSADKATLLTQGLLSFSRKQIINPKPVNLNEIVINVVKLLLRLIGEDVKLKTILSYENMQIVVDSGQIGQVLMNLATNARDAMPDGGLLIIETGLVELVEEFVKTFGYGKAGKYALISITDSGVGMDRKTCEKIFEPFFTTKEPGKGTGLGLSIVYGIIKQHNGFIDVCSEQFKGTTFNIYLPVSKAHVKEVNCMAPSAPQGGHEVVLVIEDDDSLRKLYKTVLDNFGYTVIEAFNGEDALKKFKVNKDRIQLCILDVIMPMKSGREVYEAVKKMKPDIKIIFASGYPEDVIEKKGIQASGAHFIQKPATPYDFLKKVREVLDT